jgi:hypothetical protein
MKEQEKIIEKMAIGIESGELKFGSDEWNQLFLEMMEHEPDSDAKQKYLKSVKEIKERDNRIDDFWKEHKDGDPVMYDPETFEPMTPQEYKNKYKNE